jgi:hypothetical protein
MDLCRNQDLLSLVGIAKMILKILQIAIPIALLIFGTLDLGKAVMAGDEKEIKGATNILIKRVVAAVAVFLLILIVSVVTGWVGGDEWKACWGAASNKPVVNPLG